MTTPNAAQPDTLADVKDKAKPFNEKLKRVLKDKPAKDLADLLGISVQTVYSWKSRGTQPPAHQLPIIADFAGCSLDYLCDNRIEVDADPTSGAKFAKPLDQVHLDDLMIEIGSRYFADASCLLGAIEIAKRTDWRAIAKAIVKDDLDGLNEEQLNSIRIAKGANQIALKLPNYDPSNKLWIVPYMKHVEGITSDDLDQLKLRNDWKMLTVADPCINLIVLYFMGGNDDPEEQERLKQTIEVMLQL